MVNKEKGEGNVVIRGDDSAPHFKKNQHAYRKKRGEYEKRRKERKLVLNVSFFRSIRGEGKRKRGTVEKKEGAQHKPLPCLKKKTTKERKSVGKKKGEILMNECKGKEKFTKGKDHCKLLCVCQKKGKKKRGATRRPLQKGQKKREKGRTRPPNSKETESQQIQENHFYVGREWCREKSLPAAIRSKKVNRRALLSSD